MYSPWLTEKTRTNRPLSWVASHANFTHESPMPSVDARCGRSAGVISSREAERSMLGSSSPEAWNMRR